MGYRNPAFAYAHAARTLGVGALTLTTGTLAAGTLARLIDNLAQGSKLLQVTADASVVAIDLDTGAGGPPTIDYLLIPAGHNLDTATVTIQEDDDAGFPSPTQLGQAVSPGAGLIALALTAATERYVRLDITSAPATVEIGEWILTNRFELTEGIDPRWSEHQLSNVRLDELPVIDFTTELSPDRRQIHLPWNRLSSANKALLDGLVSGVGGRRDPFWVWSPDDSTDPAWVRFERDPDGAQGSPVPQVTGPQFDREFRMLERLG